MRDWDSGHMDAGWGLGMVLLMLALWLLVAVAVVFLVRSAKAPTRPNDPPAAAGSSAERILAERFARGEIDAEEFRLRRELLRAEH